MSRCSRPARDDMRMVRSNFLISEFRGDETRASCPAGAATASSSSDGRWEIEVRQVNLIDCDQNLRNPSIVI